MTHSRYHWSAILFLTALGCGGQAAPDQRSFLVTNIKPTTDEGGLNIGGSVPAWAGNLRVKANGRYIAYDSETPMEIAPGTFGHAQIGATVPSTTYELAFVNRAGQTLLQMTDPVAVPPIGTVPVTGAFVWIHDSPSGLVAEVPDVTPDADPSTVQIRVSNVSQDERVIFSLCRGHANCPGCVTSPLPGQDDFAPGDCTALTTVASGGTWSSLQPITSLAPFAGYDSSCVAVQLEGQPLAPACAVELDISCSGFQDVVDLFIDGMDGIVVLNANGSVKGKYPGMFPHGNKFF